MSEHYDLTAGRRAGALQLGAQPISYLRDVPQLLAQRRRAHLGYKPDACPAAPLLDSPEAAHPAG